jgi:hypothetical protein
LSKTAWERGWIASVGKPLIAALIGGGIAYMGLK